MTKRRGTYTQNRNTIDSSKIITGLTVEVKGNDTNAFNRALKTFNKKCQNAGVLKEVRDRRYYIKPSERRQLAKKAARARHLKSKKDL